MKSRRYAKCRTIKEVRALNKAQGYNFFSPDTLQFFNSIVIEDVFGGCVFVTSEQNGYGNPRLYTIRAIQANGRIETLSDFQEFEALNQAIGEAQRFASKLSKG
tara:strand:+ start:989 stop:1300 length:312 start_codon:yes stop_codon:yes gene_type:complete